MRVLWKNMKEGKVKLLVDTLDDLWYLSSLIEADDLAAAVTYRRGETHTDAKRDKRGEKKRMFLTLKVQKVEFHEFADRLRVMGVITEGPQDHGRLHTFDLEPGDDITIQKEEWCPHHWERIDEARKAATVPIVTFVSIDDETATVAVLRPQGLQVIATIHSDIQGKQFEHKAKGEKKAYFDEVLETIEHHLKARSGLQAKVKAKHDDKDDKDKKKGPRGPAQDTSRDIVVLGPGFYKEEFATHVRESKFEGSVYVESASQAGAGGIREVLKSGVSKVIEKAKAAEDERLMGELLAEIGRGGKFTYGHDEVAQALRQGAVETVLLTDDFLKNERMPEIGKLASETRAKLRVLSTGYDAGKRLEGLGGLAALLRYKIED